MSAPDSAAERAYAAIRGAIQSGEIPAGSMISENDMAQMVGVSRTPIRSAIVRLQDEQWLTIFPRRGALVREITADEAANIIDARLALELSTVRRSVGSVHDTLLKALRSSLVEQQDALQGGTRGAFVRLDIEFHRHFVEASHNPILLDFYDRLRDRQALMISQGLNASHERGDQILQEHRDLVTSFEQQDWNSFETVLKEHLISTHKAFKPSIA